VILDVPGRQLSKSVYVYKGHEAAAQNEKAANFNLAAFFRLTVAFA
jgi:hypothetical protein